MEVAEPNVRLRRTVYTLLTLITVAAAAARVVGVELVYEPSLHRDESDTSPDAPPRIWPKARPTSTPTFSSNDKSRWATIRALVDEHTFAIGRRDTNADGTYRDHGIIFEDGWRSVDKILDPVEHVYYSSKPPLLPVLLAGEYWLIQRLTGWTLKDDTRKVVVTMLLTVNIVPLAVYLLLIARLLERFGRSDWGRLFTFAAACFGTFITTFSDTLNNHTVAAYMTLAAVYPLLVSEHLSVRALLASGLFASLAAAFELPATAFLAALAAGLLVVVPRRMPAFVLAALLPLATQAALNYAAIGDWKPAYEKLDGPWYRYPGSHWERQGPDARGIDSAGFKEPRSVYAFHLLVGHHGVFSLTPIWILAVGGMIASTVRSESGNRWRQVMLLTFAVSAVVTVFFAWWVSTANYGGWTSGARWFFWLTPLWLLALLPAADWFAERCWGRALAYMLLAVSVFSAAFPAINPWRHPWLFQLLEYLGWVRY
jgi:hypothetical protein